MMRHFALSLAVVAALAACTDDRDTPGPDPTGSACDPAFGAWARAGFSGSIAVSTDGALDCAAGYGRADEASGVPNTPETVFAIGSITKAFTAAAIVALAQERKLSLEDRVGALLPELTGQVAAATVRQVLLHTSGLNGSHGEDYEPLTREAALAAINGMRLAFEPGTGYVYSNAGYTMLALVIEKVSGMTYRRYVASRILRLPDGRVAGGFWNGEPAAPGPRGTPALMTAGGGGDVGHNAVVAWLPEKRRVVALASNRPEITAEALLKVVAPALLAGRTDEGRKEREGLESSLGPIGDIRLAGTLFADGEFHTYVTLTAGGRTVLGWYAVNGEGGIEAAEVPTAPPALPLAPAGGTRYRPDDPTGADPDITVEFGGDRLTITGPAGTAVAKRAR